MGQNPSLFEQYGSEGRLLFTNNDYLSPKSSISFKSLKQYFLRENSHLAFLLFVRSCTEILYGQVLDRFYAVMDVFFGKVLSSLFLLQTNTYIYDELGGKIYFQWKNSCIGSKKSNLLSSSGRNNNYS